MHTVGFLHKRLRHVAYAVMRRNPRLRQKVRAGYWGIQKKRYDRFAAGQRVDPKKVLFEAYGGRSYACSPRAIYEAMLADPRYDDFEFCWSFKGEERTEEHRQDRAFKRAQLFKRGSQEYYNAISTAGAIVVNTRLPEYVTPKPDQVFVQCWHGTPLKRLGYDVTIDMHNALNTTDELADRFGLDSEKWTYLLSPSAYTSGHLADAFGLPADRRAGTIIEEGYPRNDRLVQLRDDEECRRRLRERFGVPEGKRALLYAPTWRDDSYRASTGYTFDYLLDFDAMRAELGDEWVVLFRPHYYIANEFDFSAYEGFVVDVSRVDDINDLYLASDVLLTDYSSVMFDYANLRRPIVLYIPDIEHYANDIRGFYFDITLIPGPLCTTTDEVIMGLRANCYADAFADAYEVYARIFCPHDDGHASERVLARIFPDS